MRPILSLLCRLAQYLLIPAAMQPHKGLRIITGRIPAGGRRPAPGHQSGFSFDRKPIGGAFVGQVLNLIDEELEYRGDDVTVWGPPNRLASGGTLSKPSTGPSLGAWDEIDLATEMLLPAQGVPMPAQTEKLPVRRTRPRRLFRRCLSAWIFVLFFAVPNGLSATMFSGLATGIRSGLTRVLHDSPQVSEVWNRIKGL